MDKTLVCVAILLFVQVYGQSDQRDISCQCTQEVCGVSCCASSKPTWLLQSENSNYCAQWTCKDEAESAECFGPNAMVTLSDGSMLPMRDLVSCLPAQFVVSHEPTTTIVSTSATKS